MTEKHSRPDSLPDFARRRLLEALRAGVPSGRRYDPEMLYVECHACGKPVLWEAGKTTEILLSAGVDVSKLDERCMILSEGCPSCSPFSGGGYTLAVVRLAGLTPEEALHMTKPGGTA